MPVVYVSPLLVVAVVLAVCYMGMIIYYMSGWLRIPVFNTSDKPAEQPFVSIIIPTRNESENIEACLNSLFNQTYPKHLYEVIVVDDYSTDPTIRLARSVQETNLLVLDLQQYLGRAGEYVPNKKKAIALGIKNAKGDIIITTDGDCIAGNEWLATMVNTFVQGNYKLMTGPVLMKPARYPIEIFQQLDVINLVAIGGATIRNGMPTMCNGANLMYRKEAFHEVEGFKGNMDVPTGDDIFIMQKIHQLHPGSVGFVKDVKACVYTRPEPSLRSFVSQRVRWVSKSSRFSDWRINAILYFAYFYNLMIVVAALAVLQPLPQSWLPLAVLGGVKVFFDWVFNIPSVWFYRKPQLWLVFPIIEVLHILYVVIIGVLSLTGKYRWKDRLVK